MKGLAVLAVLALTVFGDSICEYQSDSLKYWICYPDCRKIKKGQLATCGYLDSVKANGNMAVWKYWLRKISTKHGIAYIDMYEFNGNGLIFESSDTVDCDDAINTGIKPNWDIP